MTEPQSGQGPRDVRGEAGGFVRLPSLRPEDLGGANFAVLTVQEAADNIAVTKPDGRRKFSCRIRFAEIMDRNFWPNETSRKIIYKMLGPDTRVWVGKRVVVEVVQTETPPPESMPTLAVWAARPNEWRGHIAAYEAQQKERAAPGPETTPSA